LPAIQASNDWDGIARWMLACRHDPVKWITEAYPWGVKGTSLADKKPRQWQIEQASRIRDRLRGSPHQPIQEATGSGHGIGKSAQVSMLGQWAVMTSPDTRGIVTANTEAQLRTKTWPEFAKWFGLLPPEIQAQFAFEATSLHIRDREASREKAWRLDAHPWSEHNTEAFAGLHNEGKRIIVLYDEASAIADKVSEVTEGALTDENTEILWLQYGNPTRTHGRFQECWGRFKHRWHTQNIDSRTVEGTNKTQLDKWVNDYGEDSDFVRVRVRGLAPSASSAQLIETTLVQQAMDREPMPGIRDPLIMSVDVARGGADEFVIAFRRGLDARSIPWVCIPGSESRDSEKMLAKIVDLAANSDPLKRPDAVFVDETGLGGPIIDRLRRLMGDDYQVLGVQFGSVSPTSQNADMRTHIWVQMREALRLGLAIPRDQSLAMQLTGPEIDHDKRDKLRLESKEDMKERLPGVGSPDRADALAISFAYNIQPRHLTEFRTGMGAKRDYDPFAADRA
jgi:hypothetical protein